MLYFPQLSTGNIAQFPFRKEAHYRTVVNESLGGSLITYSDSSAKDIRWRLRYLGLIDEERLSLEQLFRATEGRLRPFLFVDPTGNVLRWSEKLTEPVWETSPYLTLTPGVEDPLGTARATRLLNTGQTDQTIGQQAPAGNCYPYCFSVLARATFRCQVSLRMEGGSEDVHTTAVVGQAWTELNCCGKGDGTASNIRAVLALEPGASLDVFGCQMQIQGGPAAYRPTKSTSAIHPTTYFLQDELEFVATGLNEHSCELELISYLGAIS